MRLLAVALLALSACLPESVESVTLSPTTVELEALLVAADARWEAAGVEADRIVIAPVGSSDGAPVRLVPERAGTGQTVQMGEGRAFVGVRWMELDRLDLDLATHELGHALGIGGPGHYIQHLDADEPEACALPAAERPVMCAHVGAVLDAATLGLACDTGTCTHFTPEGGAGL